VIEPEGKVVPAKGELQAVIQLCQALYDPSGELPPTSLEFMEEFSIYLQGRHYYVEKTNFFIDYENLINPIFRCTVKESAGIEDINTLNSMICEAPVRPADI
jgi:hypothetical protein